MTTKPEQLGEVVKNRTLRQSLVKRLCDLTGWDKDSFPGSQPVSLTRNVLNNQLLKTDYYAAEKSDGVRYMMIIEKGVAYLIDRNCTVIKTNVRFPVPGRVNGEESQLHSGTVLDGEMLLEQDGEKNWLMFSVYDLVAVHGKRKGEEKLYNRLKYVQTEVIGPRGQLEKQTPHLVCAETFQVKLKAMYQSQHVQWIFDKVIHAAFFPWCDVLRHLSRIHEVGH